MGNDIVIVAGARTACGRAIRGTLAHTRPDDMGAAVIKEVVRRAPGVEKAEVDDVVMGCSWPESCQGFNIGRVVATLAGFPDSVPGQTVNRHCASGLQAIAIGAQQIMSGMCNIVIAGGTESMSLIPAGGGHHISLNLRVVEELPEVYVTMGTTAENVARKYEISREDQDTFSMQSHQRALAAIAGGRFTEEIVPLQVEHVYVDDNGKRVESVKTFDKDECPRNTSLGKMAELRPVFHRNGTVTAGNSSQMSDGAAAVLMMNEKTAKEKGLEPLARYVGYAVAGVPSELMGIGPMVAIPRVMEVTGMNMEDMDLIELNEAFASQALACIQQLDLDQERVNVNGGAIALGHPLGCTGAKLTIQIINEMKRRKVRYGLVSMCIGGGMGAAGIFEAL